MGLLFRLLRQNISIVQVLGFLLVNLIGGIIVLSGIQAAVDFDNFSGDDDQLLSGGYVVISKPVTSVTTIGNMFGLRPSFNDREIDELESLSAVSSVGTFVSSEFKVKAALSIGQVNIRTDIFLEAVPDEFIKNDFNEVGGVQRKWSASPHSDTIPIIIPRNYYNLYNFGFATSHGLPQISDDMLGVFPIKLYIRGMGGVVEYDAVVCGLTNKLNTILVPMDFMQQANALFAPDVTPSPSRLILATDASQTQDSLFDFLRDNEYVIEGDSSHVRLQAFIHNLLLVVIAIGFVFSLLAFFLLVISILLLIEKNKEKIVNLYSIGYSVGQVSVVYKLMVVVVDFVVWCFAAILTAVVYPQFSNLMQNASPDFRPASLLPLFLVATGLFLLFAFMHAVIVDMRIRKQCS
ncbi:MAG: hypothetical protein IKY71_01525 [Bacteroidaceae bacterium]|nr:hypothetical protein [Bacteroidaceae bacterium]